MEKDPGKNLSDSGLELDMLEISKRPSSGKIRTQTGCAEQKPFLPETAQRERKGGQLVGAMIITAVILLVAMVAYLQKQNLFINFLSGSAGKGSGDYLRVGPVSATLADNDTIMLTLDIDCKNDSLKKNLAGKDSLIRDKIVSVITAPDISTFLKQHKYGAIRARIRKSLEEVSGEPIGEVYFAELTTY